MVTEKDLEIQELRARLEGLEKELIDLRAENRRLGAICEELTAEQSAVLDAIFKQ